MTDPLDAPGALQRRAVLKKMAAAGAVFWAAPAIESFVSVAAAASGPTTTLTVPLVKTINGNNQPDPDPTVLCTIGGVGKSDRGLVTFTRNPSLNTICATITLSTGTDAVGRTVQILQSSGTTCLAETATVPAAWEPTPAKGPQTFCADLFPGATTFVVALTYSGGGGVDGWSSYRATP